MKTGFTFFRCVHGMPFLLKNLIYQNLFPKEIYLNVNKKI
jgi:hypothetical protein